MANHQQPITDECLAIISEHSFFVMEYLSLLCHLVVTMNDAKHFPTLTSMKAKIQQVLEKHSKPKTNTQSFLELPWEESSCTALSVALFLRCIFLLQIYLYYESYYKIMILMCYYVSDTRKRFANYAAKHFSASSSGEI